ncbi:MAG: exodeoxyribonuclease VII large subunit [Ketobacteraceae bacterium]|nr:exodeoxyribonuclease VII large subunit [Ketobacteraceae bacterium]
MYQESDTEPDTTHQEQRHIFSVSELNQFARQLLEDAFPMIWLEAEVSNLVQPSSGHIYLTLKDDKAQVRAAMFRGNNRHLKFKPRNGDQVLVKGRLSLYAPRGDYQLIIDTMEEAGLGALQRAFEALKNKLDQEGLFAEHHKKPLPEHPQTVGVITSPTGAAVQDILSVLKRRFPLLPVIVYPCAVQGDEAPQQIIRALETANRRRECDVLIVGRGGGSLEDLWAFNNEALARAIFSSAIPVVAAVGHQIDFTIADFVADVRAPTPSAAAEMLSPDQQELLARFQAYQQLLLEKMQNTLIRKQQLVEWYGKRLKHPGKQLEEQKQRLDLAETRLTAALQRRLRTLRDRHHHWHQRLTLQSPLRRLDLLRQTLSRQEIRLYRGMEQQRRRCEQRLAHAARQLQAVSPLATLSRGYAIVKNDEQQIVRSVTAVKPGDIISTQLADGKLTSTVTGTVPDEA